MKKSRLVSSVRCSGIWMAVFLLGAVLAALMSVIIDLFVGKNYSNMTSLYAYIMFFVVSVAYCVLVEKRPLDSMGFHRRRRGKYYLNGIIRGFMVCFLMIIFLLFTGNIEIVRSHDNQTWLFFCWIIGYMIQGLSEEVIFRGYLLQSLRQESTTVLAVLISSLLFALAHVFNSGMDWLALINTFLIGIFLALLMVAKNNIWLVGGFHAMYNITQVNIFEITLSGNSLSKASWLLVSPADSANIWGLGEYGLVGSRATTLVFLAVIILLVYQILKKNGTLALWRKSYNRNTRRRRP